MLRAKLNRLSSKYDWAALFPECCLRHSAQRAPAAAAPTAHTSNTDKATLDKDVAGKKFIKSRVHIANEFYNAYNNIVFDNMLPCDTVITWNKRMLKKAGQAVLTTNRRDGSKTACIELSEKVRICESPPAA